jgi:hypothetical protein
MWCVVQYIVPDSPIRTFPDQAKMARNSASKSYTVDININATNGNLRCRNHSPTLAKSLALAVYSVNSYFSKARGSPGFSRHFLQDRKGAQSTSNLGEAARQDGGCF